MKNVLIIEDDEFKANNIRDLIVSSGKYSDVSLVSSLVEAIEAINKYDFDLILIDMAIPSHPVVSGGGAPMSLLTGGLEILLELQSIEKAPQCIIITQYPDIEISGEFYTVEEAAVEIKNLLGCEVLECIKYIEGSESWKTAIKKVLNLK
jgi:CheY-like chemotaxis protein